MKKFNSFKPLTFVEKRSILDVRQGSAYTFALSALLSALSLLSSFSVNGRQLCSLLFSLAVLICFSSDLFKVSMMFLYSSLYVRSGRYRWLLMDTCSTPSVSYFPYVKS